MAKLSELTLRKLLQKNPYLYRSIGVNSASDYISAALDAFISSSDETIFGNEFFEPLAKWAAEEAFRDQKDITVQVGGGSGFDISIESPKEYRAIAVKSGKNIFNVQSGKQQNTEFSALQARIRKEKKVFHPIIGFGYGRKKQKKSNPETIKLAGQAFWEEITGEANFYVRMSSALGNKPIQLATEFKLAYDKSRNKLEKEFHMQYTDSNGGVGWENVIAFSSAKVAPKKASMPVEKKTKKPA